MLCIVFLCMLFIFPHKHTSEPMQTNLRTNIFGMHIGRNSIFVRIIDIVLKFHDFIFKYY